MGLLLLLLLLPKLWGIFSGTFVLWGVRLSACFILSSAAGETGNLKVFVNFSYSTLFIGLRISFRLKHLSK